MEPKQSRISLLIAEFPRFLDVFGRNPVFSRSDQLQFHLDTIRRRRALGSTAKALGDDQFVQSLYRRLRAWGIGVRASKLRAPEEFAKALRAETSELAALENVSIDDPTLSVKAVGERLWHLIDTLDIVDNNARIVPGRKALHHLLPELVVPMDREYT